MIQRGFEHRHEVVHLIYAATNEADAVRRLVDLLQADQAQIDALLDQPLRHMLPEYRDRVSNPPAEVAGPMTA